LGSPYARFLYPPPRRDGFTSSSTFLLPMKAVRKKRSPFPRRRVRTSPPNSSAESPPLSELPDHFLPERHLTRPPRVRSHCSSLWSFPQSTSPPPLPRYPSRSPPPEILDWQTPSLSVTRARGTSLRRVTRHYCVPSPFFPYDHLPTDRDAFPNIASNFFFPCCGLGFFIA